MWLKYTIYKVIDNLYFNIEGRGIVNKNSFLHYTFTDCLHSEFSQYTILQFGFFFLNKYKGCYHQLSILINLNYSQFNQLWTDHRNQTIS